MAFRKSLETPALPESRPGFALEFNVLLMHNLATSTWAPATHVGDPDSQIWHGLTTTTVF